MNARYQLPIEMNSVEVLAADREEDEVEMGRGGQVGLKIGSLTRIKGDGDQMSPIGEDEAHIVPQAKDVINSQGE